MSKADYLYAVFLSDYNYGHLLCRLETHFSTVSSQVVKMLALHISADNQRLLDNDLLLLETEWKLYEMEKQFGQQRCNKNEDRSRKNVSWLTVMVSNDFVVPALVLGDLIQTFTCHKTMIALISENVSKDTQKALQSVGWETRLVEEMDCN